MGKSKVAPEIRAEILRKIREGGNVTAISKEYGFSDKTVYRWISCSADPGDNRVLEINRLKRENQALKEIIGQITFERELAKKRGFNI